MSFLGKTEQYATKYQMFCEGDGIVLGVSGGADSVCLLHVLCALRDKYRLTLTVVHVHHGIRGEDADADEAFVRELCRRKETECRVFHENVPELSKQWGCSEEEAGREVRYQAFEAVCAECGAKWIAVAHNQNDNAETFLFHAFRGSGLTGLQGILPRRGRIIRPLLWAGRSEIEAYLKEVNQTWCEDATNAAMDYARNRIRNGILRQACQINDRAVQHLADAAAELSQIEELMQEITEEAGRKVCEAVGKGEVQINIERLRELPEVLQKRVLMLTVEHVAGRRRDIGRIHMEALLGLAEGETGKRISLPYRLTAERSYSKLRIFREAEVIGAERTAEDERNGFEETEEIFCRRVTGFPYEAELASGEFMLSLMECEKIHEIPKNNYTKWFDYDKIAVYAFGGEKPAPAECTDGGNIALSLRNRREGDYIVIHKDGRKKTLKSLFISEKVERSYRSRMPLLACGSRILWAVGLRSDEGFYVDENTKHILVAELRKRG